MTWCLPYKIIALFLTWVLRDCHRVCRIWSNLLFLRSTRSRPGVYQINGSWHTLLMVLPFFLKQQSIAHLWLRSCKLDFAWTLSQVLALLSAATSQFLLCLSLWLSSMAPLIQSGFCFAFFFLQAQPKNRLCGLDKGCI